MHFLLLFSLTFVIAQPPFQSSSEMLGINIEAPVIETHILEQDFNFKIHAHNSSNGLLLTNDTTNCVIHVYTPINGTHLIKENMTFEGGVGNLDFEFLVDGGNFSDIGQYAVLFYCEVSGEIGGFFEYAFDVTATGVHLSLWDAFVRIFLIIFFACLMAGAYRVVGHIDFKKWNDIIIKKYQTRNFVKMVLSILLFNIMNNVFIIYYLIGLPMVLILTDLTRVYNIAGMVLFMDVFLSVYLMGLIIVGLIFISYVQEWIVELLDLVKDMDWGIR